MGSPDDRAEWLEADGLGGFASGTASGVRTRRYHALLLTATTPPTGRMVLVNGFEAWVETPAGRFALTSQRYAPGVVHPDGASRIEVFDIDPWPTWSLRLEDGTRLVQEIFVERGRGRTIVSWRPIEAKGSVRLFVRPLLSGRDYHGLHHENPAFRFEPDENGALIVWRPYPGVPGVASLSNGRYHHDPDWYRNFLYDQERERGLDDIEDLASPGVLRWDLAHGEAFWVLTAEGPLVRSPQGRTPRTVVQQARRREHERRRGFATRLHRAADAYLVRRGSGKTIVAGYPWFTDWGRDTFIALRGLCLATGRLADARDILLAWAGAVSRGMLPNRFPDSGAEPEFNAVDASLWYIVAVHELLAAAKRRSMAIRLRQQRALRDAVDQILAGYAAGTRHGIGADVDGLLAAGEPGVQLTWMDARVDGRVVTPRIGKPVEVQALWLNALWIASRHQCRWKDLFEKGRRAFGERFWNEAGGCLYDVVDVDRVAGRVDPAFRPNQILAVGGLPLALVGGDRARRVVDAVEHRLLVPLGLRSLAPGEPGYAPRYEGDSRTRDAAYHQGTAWPWLIGPFVEAWVRVHGGPSARTCRDARERFLAPLIRHLDEAGIGHVSEIVDANAPHTPRGCPFQAWSLGELLRLDQVVLRAGEPVDERTRVDASRTSGDRSASRPRGDAPQRKTGNGERRKRPLRTSASRQAGSVATW